MSHNPITIIANLFKHRKKKKIAKLVMKFGTPKDQKLKVNPQKKGGN